MIRKLAPTRLRLPALRCPRRMASRLISRSRRTVRLFKCRWSRQLRGCRAACVGTVIADCAAQVPGALVPVEFDRNQPDILMLNVIGYEELTW